MGLPEPIVHTLTCPNPKGLLGRGLGMHQLHYYDWGDPDAKQVVVCVHGLTRNGRDFDFLACELAKVGFRVICPDIVGRGKSEWLKFPKWYGYPLYVTDMMLLIGQLGLSSVHWVGTSMGGLIGMMVEAGTPHIIDKLVLNDIGPFIPKDALNRIGEYVGQDMCFATLDEAEALLKINMAPFGIKDPVHWEHVVRHTFIEKNGEWCFDYDPAIAHPFRTRSGKQKNLPDIDLWQMWNVIHCPTLVLHGKDSDLLNDDTVERMKQKDAVEKVVEFQGIGHAPMLMDEEQMGVVVEWLKG